jgi:hypothetical protein
MNYGFATEEGAWKRGVGRDRVVHRRLVTPHPPWSTGLSWI